MSLQKELRELQEKRTRLEEESLSLMEQQRKLEERARALEQKMMDELSARNEESRRNISRLESMINSLEQRLGPTTKEAAANEPTGEAVSETPSLEATEDVNVEVNPTVLENAAQDSAVVASVSDSSTVTEKPDPDSDQGSKRKKHKFWETHGY